MRSKTGSREPFIDVARILTASLLFYFHAGFSTNWPLSGLFGCTTFVFIFIAGFCAVRYSRSCRPGSAQTSGFLSFPLQRLQKIYPIFWIVCFTLFFASFIHPASTMSGPFHWSSLAMNLFGLNQYFGVRYLGRTMWFIPFVVQVYFLIPLVLRIPFRPVTTMGGCFALSLVSSLLVFKYAPINAAEICRTWSPLFRLPEVYLGIAAAMSQTRTELLKTFVSYLAGATLLAAAAPHWPALTTTLTRPMNGFTLGLVVGAAAWLLTRPWRGNDLFCAATARLGKASYAFFLLHGAMIVFVWQTFGDSPVVWILYFLGMWGASLAIVGSERALREKLSGLGFFFAQSVAAEDGVASITMGQSQNEEAPGG